MSDIAFDTPIVMLHGLGGRPFTCIPLEFYLRCSGYQNIHRPWYPADQHSDIEKGLAALDEILLKRGLRKDQPIVAIGQSMGGIYANRLHERGWTVLLGIYIGSPMNGAALLPILEKKTAPVCAGLHDEAALRVLEEARTGSEASASVQNYHTGVGLVKL